MLSEYGKRTVEPEVVSVGADRLVGWYTSPECKNSQKFLFGRIVSEPIDLYAKWSDEVLEVNFDYNDGSDRVETQTIFLDQTVNPITPVRDDATFVGWYTDVDVYNSTLFDFNTPITQSITLYARWNKNYFNYDQMTKSFTSRKFLSSTNFQPITSDFTTSNGGWYFVDGRITVNDRLVFNGDTNLVFFSNSTLTAKKGIEVNGNLNVYSDNEKGGGRITISATGMDDNTVGILFKNGLFTNVNLSVSGGDGAYGISGEDVTFINCSVNLTCSKSPTALSCNNLTLISGSLTAQSSDVAISVSGTKNISKYFSVKAGDSSTKAQAVTEYGGKKYVKIEEPSVLEGKEGSCLENGLLPAYKNSKNGIYYLEKTYKTAIGNFEQLVVWADSPERQTRIGHKWVS
ncbi:MAG: InlB B-repeat-containing protein, partial [Clostridia bacterium]|nr:InlB B-repeat-containing protein [Clostridia bacterium]